MKRLLLILIISSGTQGLYAQSLSPYVISAAGHFGSSTDYSLSSTTGETMVTTYESSDHILTQGFQQPLAFKAGEDEDTTSVKNLPGPDMWLYPNPVADNLFLKIAGMQSAHTEVRIYNAIGQVIAVPQERHTEGASTHYHFDMQGLAPGLYLVRITDVRSQEAYTLKVQRTGR